MRILLGISIIILLVAFLLESEGGDSDKASIEGIKRSLGQDQSIGNCRGFDFSGKVSDGFFVQHGGQKVRVRIPVDYLLFPEAGSTFTREGDGKANFNFHRETLKPYPRHEMFGKIIAGKEEWVSFLVTNLIEIDAIAKFSANLFSGTEMTSETPSFPERLVSEDLFEVQFQPTWQAKNLFFGKTGTLITDVISCDVPALGNFPHCQQITRLGKFDVKIGYPRDQITHWKLLKEKTNDLLECMAE
ncbi:hypothetical protein [Rhizobium sp. HT1-10]|uniref:hypothetical protein n=1 Tax=Rhizobium sp. HT1-10 TaxID=3111638 RepID=UPI003C1B2062